MLAPTGVNPYPGESCVRTRHSLSDIESPIRSDKSPWWWHPELPIEDSPLFTWPPRPLPVLNAVLGKGFLWSPQILYVGLAILTWLHFGGSLERCVEFQVGS